MMPSKIFLRRQAILEYLASAGEPKSVWDIVQYLEGKGYLEGPGHRGGDSKRDPREKSIQRDLVYLNDQADIPVGIAKQEGRTNLWAYTGKISRLHTDVGNNTDLALTVIMADKYLARVLPQSTRQSLAELIQSAQDWLVSREKLTRNDFALLAKRIEFDQRGARLADPDIDPAVISQVLAAIVAKRRIRFRYKGRDKLDEASVYGLIIKEPKIYMVAAKETDKKPYWPLSFLLHRVSDVEVTKGPSRTPADFNLREYIEENQSDPLVDFEKSGDRKLVLRVKDTGNLIADLEQTGIGKNPRLVKDKAPGFYRYTVEVKFTYPLLEWILGRGSDVEVIGDKWMRSVVSERLQAAAAHYKKD